MKPGSEQQDWLTSPGRLVGWKPFRRIRFACPDCAISLSMPEGEAGRTGRCPSCERLFFTPNVAAEKPAMMPALSPGRGQYGELPTARSDQFVQRSAPIQADPIQEGKKSKQVAGKKPKKTPPLRPPGGRPDGDSPGVPLRSAIPGSSDASETDPKSLAYHGLLFQSAEERVLFDAEDAWRSGSTAATVDFARLRAKRVLDASGIWLVIAAGVAVSVSGLALYVKTSRAEAEQVVADPIEDELLLAVPTERFEKLIFDINASPPGPERAEFLRPVDGILEKMSRDQTRFPDGHRFVLQVGKYEPASPAASGAERLYALGDTDGRRVRYLFEEISPDRWVLDWESAVGYCETDWEEFVRTSPNAPRRMRVVAVEDDYYNDEFDNRRTHVCLKLRDFHDRAHCWGYARRNSDVGRRLAPWLSGDTAATITVELEFPPPDPDLTNQQRHQVWIRRVVSASWITE